MDANTIRLILIVVGALLILLLYLWERHREKADEAGVDEFEDEAGFADDDEEDSPYGVRTDKREPSLGVLNDADEPPVAPRSSSSKAVKPSVADPEEDEPPPKPRSAAAQAPLEPLLIQVSVSARRAHFKGAELLDVAETCGLHPGDMDIFHCLDEFDDETRIYFSMANMVKPGTFPFDDMDDFTTPGLMLFAQLEGDPEDMTILEEMIAAARKLAIALNGDVLDDTRKPLTVNKEESMRKAVLANERRWAQAYPQ